MTTTIEVKQRPILFSGPMVRAILDGRKTQTRRALKEQPPNCEGRWSWIASSTERNEVGKFRYSWIDANTPDSRPRDVNAVSYRCPFGSIGDRLWVREAFAVVPKVTDDGPKHKAKGDGTGVTWKVDWNGNPSGFKWKPSIYMPRWASRITLEVTGVRVERLNEISRGDCMSEGCPFPNMAKTTNPIAWFSELWESINGEGSWALNPWVWVIEFKRVGWWCN